MNTDPIPMLDLVAQYRALAADIETAAKRVLQSQRFILGPEGEALEREIATYSACNYAVALSSGTDAVLAALMALGVGPGDEVITTPYTFLGTVTSIARLGARAVFVDIDRNTYNLDVPRVEAAIGPRTRCILPVHLFGQMTDMTSLADLARRRGIVVIEDAAQAIGASCDGKRVGTESLAATLSFHPSKNLGGAGDGGMLLTNDQGLAKTVRLLRNQGQSRKHVSAVIGGNFRLDEIQASILRVKLRYLEAWTSARRGNAAAYREAFARRALLGSLELPHEAARVHHVYNQFVVRTPRRDELKAFLADARIESGVYYPLPMHLQDCFSHWGGCKGQFPQAEQAAQETLALPIHPELRPNQIERVADVVGRFFCK